ncbi:NPP1 family protein [Sinorhizobium medicae]|uniref:NPP1 family protein n=1 Tax=Sinorhizobium medicae TaxID=110321 RepID=UPI0012962BEF|nr:hypothetical protein [Sinorhizobium medicae]
MIGAHPALLLTITSAVVWSRRSDERSLLTQHWTWPLRPGQKVPKWKEHIRRSPINGTHSHSTTLHCRVLGTQPAISWDAMTPAARQTLQKNTFGKGVPFNDDNFRHNLGGAY